LLIYQIIILGVIQGLTEFLPVSSSGHLVILPHFFNWPDQGRAMEVAVHVGTLGAVLIYFWKDVLSMFTGFLSLLRGKVTTGGRLFILLCIGTVPAIIFGFILSTYDLMSRSVSLIGWTMIIYALVLYIIDRLASTEGTIKQISGPKVFLVGCAQALSLIPGTSRSGACMTMMRFLGFNRCDAARFSFLLAVPSIIAAASLTAYQLLKQGQFSSFYKDASIAAMISFVAGLIAINFMLTWLRNGDFTPFVVYRLCLGGFLLYWAYYL
jgi:undecaprenyl-diphosphatase